MVSIQEACVFIVECSYGLNTGRLCVYSGFFYGLKTGRLCV